MAGINKAILIGRLGKDPEAKSLRDGKKFCTLSLATSKKIKGEEKTEWHSVTVWNENDAKYLCDYAAKGSIVYVEGEIETRSYEKDGVKHYATSIVCGAFGSKVQIIDGFKDKGGKSKGTSGSVDDYEQQSNGGKTAAERELDDEIPF